MNFNERLIELRKSKGLSQDELGEKLQVSRQAISKWETGQSYPDFEKLVNISDYYGLSLDELVRGVSVQDVRDKIGTEKQITEIYEDIQKVKSLGKSVIDNETMIVLQKILERGIKISLISIIVIGIVMVLIAIIF